LRYNHLPCAANPERTGEKERRSSQRVWVAEQILGEKRITFKNRAAQLWTCYRVFEKGEFFSRSHREVRGKTSSCDDNKGRKKIPKVEKGKIYWYGPVNLKIDLNRKWHGLFLRAVPRPHPPSLSKTRKREEV